MNGFLRKLKSRNSRGNSRNSRNLFFVMAMNINNKQFLYNANTFKMISFNMHGCNQGIIMLIVDTFCYLGDMLSAGGGVEEAVCCRVRCAWGKFNELMPILTMRGTSLKVKGKIYKACVQSVMMYGSETWAMKVEDTQKLKRTEASMMRRMCGVSLKKHLSNEVLRGRLGIDCVSDLVRRSRLRWFGHVVRKDDQQWVRKCMDFKVDDSAGRDSLESPGWNV